MGKQVIDNVKSVHIEGFGIPQRTIWFGDGDDGKLVIKDGKLTARTAVNQDETGLTLEARTTTVYLNDPRIQSMVIHFNRNKKEES